MTLLGADTFHKAVLSDDGYQLPGLPSDPGNLTMQVRQVDCQRSNVYIAAHDNVAA
jgi:hypothetical protein